MERVKEWMKLHIVLVIVLLCSAVPLCRMVFQEGRNIRGVVVEIQTREDGTLASFVLERDGKRTGVIMTENTRAWPRERVLGQTYEKTCQVFQEELRDAEVTAWCVPFRMKLETAEGRITAYRARAACSSLYFSPPERIEWRMVFHRKPAEDIEVDLPLPQG